MSVLEVVGLPPEVDQVYEVLLDARGATVGDLAATVGLPQRVVRAALRTLRDLGLVRAAGSPPAYTAVDPNLALDALMLEQEVRLRRARVHAGEVSERFRHAAAGQDPAEMVEVLIGGETIVERGEQLQRSARRELRYLDKPPFRPEYQCVNEPEMDFLRAGGVARTIYETAAIPDRLPAVEMFLQAGEQARALPVVPTKLMIVDDRVGFVPLRTTGDAPSGSYLVVHRSALLDALCELFETLWLLALPLHLPIAGAAPEEEGRPDPVERLVLGLMNAGLSDEAIAGHLGLSERTLQRRIRDLMARLGVHTRYQLGARAAAWGWTAPAGSPPAVPGG